MTDLKELITNIELCSRTDGYSTITFPTLKKLSVSDVVTIWSSVSKHVQQWLLQRKPRAVRVPGLGTFLIKKWLSFENEDVLTFQRPLFVLSRTVAQIRELQHASVPVPDDMKKVSVSWKNIHSDVPYSEEVVQNCMQETLNYFYFILRNRKDTDFILKDLGTLAIRGTVVTMAFCKDFLLRLNKSTYVVEKLLTKKLVISDKEVTLSPSHFGHVYQLPQFETRAVPRRMYLTDEEICIELERALSSMGIRAAVHHTLRLLRRGVSPNRLARAQMEEAAEEKAERRGSPGRSLPQRASAEGRQAKTTPFESPELPLPTSEEQRQTGQQRESVFGMNGRRKLEASLPKRKETEENGKSGSVSLPELPQPQAGTESDKMPRAQLSQEEEDSLRPTEITSGIEEGLQTAEAWIQGRRQLRTELESFGDIEKWLRQKPSQNDQEKRYWERPKAHRADRRAVVQSAVTDSLDSKDSPIERKEKCRMVRSGDGPVDEHCLPSTVETDLGELVDRYRRNALTSYLESSRRCKERNVHITKPTLQKALLHPGDKIIKEGQDIGKIRQPGGYYSTGLADAGSTCRSGSASRSQMEAEKRHLQNKKMQKSNDNNFWPGHLLDKLCLYFPEKQHDRAHALFSCVQPTKPAYRGT
ncbi:coiled-coil domain-containing protein 81-like isoform X2 [Grus americana]|uniref:coiled-coil domain-containing protein 81-like isoform X2 n=1 Tax=Grus americana TaxID=9117 RepID=UPI0024079953|nr:coiled-coil domain-containing protein 81-like isoform X2 [Grus americana]